jgi:hypothetical protein
MSRQQNLLNLSTEKDGISILRSHRKDFYTPSIDERKMLYEKFDIDYRAYSRSMDGILLNVGKINEISALDDFFFVEIKTTKSKSVTKLPYGVFFGFTKNEEELFSRFSNYRLCLVHVNLNTYYLLDYKEYLTLIKNKRVQYQINFVKEDNS